VHVGIEACKRAGVPLLVAGQVFPYEEHRRYFEQEVLPRLDRSRRFIGPVGGTRKQTLLAAARCLLIPSLVDETSSLAAGEALAAGTPVVAFAKGALANTIRHGETGFLAHDREGMAAAISAAGRIEPDACRRVAREHYSLERMIERYFDVYRRLAQHGRQPFAA
jgi:glycosyltransferase involved in cell wall biosynthesis